VNPYLLAFVASVCFGVVVFPWQATLRSVGLAGFLGVTGAVYFFTGLVVYMRFGIPEKVTFMSGGAALLSAGLYTIALVLCSYVFSRQGINVSVAAAITAAYPAWTTLIAVLVLRQRLSVTESAFLLLILVGVIGLALSSKPIEQ
jgi:drug/metabolite transporter (DMT)-like permease